MKRELNEKLTKEESFWWRFVTIITLTSMMTICIIYIFEYLIPIGNFGKYFAGALAGSFWGYVWNMYCEHPGKKLHTLTTLQYIIILLFSIGLLIYVWWAVNFLITR